MRGSGRPLTPAVGSIEATGRQALAELRRVLDASLLRKPGLRDRVQTVILADEAGPVTPRPQPGDPV